MNSVIKTVLGRAVARSKRWLSNSNPLEVEDRRLSSETFRKINRHLLSMVGEGGPASTRPNYGWGVLRAAHLANTLGLKEVSVIEFGVAGGNGLVALETIAEKVEKVFGVDIAVYGFDTGEGLPKPLDYRDMPFAYSSSTYRMDVPKLKSRLHRAELKLGLISETLPEFLSARPAPTGFISIDVDYYTSTVDALRLLDADTDLLLPRIHCYFDDIMGSTAAEFLGERLAINEFNQNHPLRKLSPIYSLWHLAPQRYSRDLWTRMFYLAHLIDHPLYCANDGTNTRTEEPLAPVATPVPSQVPAFEGLTARQKESQAG
jgi:hypothetical protein